MPKVINRRQKAKEKKLSEIREAIFATIDPKRIAENLRQFTKEPHVAGTEANKRVNEQKR